MANGTLEIGQINITSPNGLITKPLTVDNYGYAKIGDERVGVTPQNWIINGMFDVWQRGTSQTGIGYGSDDRWYNDGDVSTKTHSRQTFTVGQTDVPNNPKYFSRTVVTSGGTSRSYTRKSQFIEDVTILAGKTISLSFWAKADGNKNISIEFVQRFGTGGSANVYQIGIQKFALTTSWQRFTKTLTLPSVSGKTIGANNNLHFMFWLDAGSGFNVDTDSLGNQSGTFDIANVCLVEGSVPVECPNEPYAEVLRKCQRYYYRQGGSTIYNVMSIGNAASATTSAFMIRLPVKMRVTPTNVDYFALSAYDGLNPRITLTSVALSSQISSPDSGYIDCGTAGGLTAYRPYVLLADDSTNGYLGISAEL